MIDVRVFEVWFKDNDHSTYTKWEQDENYTVLYKLDPNTEKDVVVLYIPTCRIEKITPKELNI